MSAARGRLAAFACACAALLAGCGAPAGSRHATADTTTGAPAGTTTPGHGQARAAAALSSENWPEFGYNPQRTDADPANTGISAANLASLKARVVDLPGTADSSPIELAGVHVDGRTRDVIILTTTYGRTLAIDAATGVKLWEYTPSDIGSYQGSAQLTTASPIADPDRDYVYAASPDGVIHKLSLFTGAEIHRGHWPVRVVLDPVHEKIASALNLSGSDLVVVTGGYFGDAPPYDGHVLRIARASGHITHVWNSVCSNRRRLIRADTCPSATAVGDNAIWGRSGAVIEPGSGRILLTTGNGAFNGSTNWGDSVLELSPTLALLHNWTPTDEAHLAANDLDLGSTSPALLGEVNGQSLAVQGGKAGVLSLLDLDRLDGTTGGASSRLGGELQDTSAPGGAQVFTTPAVWHEGGRTWVFVADDAGTAAYTLAGGGGKPRLAIAWQSGTGGTSPILAGGLLYVYDPAGGLKVYEPTSGHLLDSLPAGSGHWNSPIVADGRIALPVGNANGHATTGTLIIFHLPGR